MVNNLGTWLYSKVFGRKVGHDLYGNIYFTNAQNNKRWLLYKQSVDPASIPPDWHCWLHYTSDAVPDSGKNNKRYSWEKTLAEVQSSKVSNKQKDDHNYYTSWNPNNEEN